MSKMKKTIMIIIVTAMITGIISIYGAYAATNYAINASKIGYSDNSNLGVDNVQAAIDGTCTKFSRQLTNLKNDVKKETIDEMYPVGSIYLSTSLTTASAVATKLGGTWEAYGQGRTLVGVGTGTDSNSVSKTFNVNETGGEYTNNLTTSEMPSHSHTIDHIHNIASKTYETNTVSLTGTISMHNSHESTPVYHASGIFKEDYIAPNFSYVVGLQTAGATSLGVIGIDASHKHTIEIGSHKTDSPSSTVSGVTGGNTSFNIQDPYVVTYMYKRTA